MLGGIYANGKPLFSGMTDAELDGEIAREADGGRLEELRSERENRTGQENADRRRRDVRLGEIEQMLSDVPRAASPPLAGGAALVLTTAKAPAAANTAA